MLNHNYCTVIKKDASIWCPNKKGDSNVCQLDTEKYRKYYNEERIHQGIGYLTPLEKYKSAKYYIKFLMNRRGIF